MYSLLNRYHLSLNVASLIEISLVLGAVVAAYFLKKIVDKKMIPYEKSASVDLNRLKQRFLKNYRYVSYPLYLTLFLILSFVFTASGELNGKVITLFTQFSILWFFLRLITAVSGSKSPKFIVISIAIILILDILNLTDATVVMLDRLSIEIGTFRLSAFLIIKIIFAFAASLWVVSLISNISKRLVSNFRGLNKSARDITVTIIDAVLYFFLFLVILKIIGFDITTIAVVGSAVGIGIGFGLQKITSNFMAGLILLFEKSIREGDVIELSSAASDIGFVKRLGIRYTLVETFDNKEIMIPNEDFITNKVTNWTFSNSLIRIRVDIGVSYDSDLELVHKLILEAGNEVKEEEVNVDPTCFLTGYGDSSVDFVLYVWVKKVELVPHKTRSDVLFKTWAKFKKHNITIPYPQRDLHLKSSEVNLGEK
jgi:small-conductance mechanosensitive channel